MNSLAQQLAKAGLVSKNTLKEAEASKILKQEQVGVSRLQNVVMVDDLKKCRTIRDFKETAKHILLHDAKQIGAVVKMAHDFKGDDGSKRLIGMMYALRDALKLAPKQEHEQIIKKALRKAGGEVNIPVSKSNKKDKTKGGSNENWRKSVRRTEA